MNEIVNRDVFRGRRIGLVQTRPGSKLLDVYLEDGEFAGAVEVSGELPFADRSISGFDLISPPQLPVRDWLQLVLECRRCLLPGGKILLPPDEGRDQPPDLTRYAALVGLSALPDVGGERGWQKRLDEIEQTPLVSVLIPAFNPRYFLESLDSALRQTYPNIEIIVCDDSEGDAIKQMTLSRAGSCPVEYHRNPTRLRAGRNYEKLLALARGKYIKFLNDDDVLAPACVQALLAPMIAMPDLALATSHRQPIDAESRPLPDMPATRPVVGRDTVVSGISLANSVIMYGLNMIGEPTTMLFRKRDFEFRPGMDEAGPFNLNGAAIRCPVDLAMAVRALLQGNAVFISSRQSSLRRHPEQAQAAPDVVQRSIEGIRSLQRQWIELGLFRRVHPNVLETRPVTATGEAWPEWQPRHLISLPPTGNLPEQDLQRWREIRNHPFDFVSESAAADAGSFGGGPSD